MIVVSKSDDLDPVEQSRQERIRRWMRRRQPTRDDFRFKHAGHYWKKLDEDPPDWYPYQDTEVHTRDDLDPEHVPDVPDQIEWSDYVAYTCRKRECQDHCINRIDSEYAQHKLCRACYPDTDLDPLPPSTYHLPQETRTVADHSD